MNIYAHKRLYCTGELSLDIQDLSNSNAVIFLKCDAFHSAISLMSWEYSHGRAFLFAKFDAQFQ